MTLKIDIQDEGIDHINVSPASKFAVGRALFPGTPHDTIDSVMGFKYRTLIQPIKYLKFDRDICLELMAAPKHEAITLYNDYFNSKYKHPIRHYRTIILIMLWERAVLDEKFRNHLISIGNLRIISYEIEVIKSTSSSLELPVEMSFNNWLGRSLAECKRAIESGFPPRLERFNNKKFTHIHWSEDVYTLNHGWEDRYDDLVYKASLL